MKVSCLMPTFNRRRFIPEAVACFHAQTLTDIELIVVDNGTDPIQDLLPTDPRIVYLRKQPRHHFCALRNFGLVVAQGKYVAIWDDDDLSHPERLAVQVAKLEETGAGLCLLASSVVTCDDPLGEWVYTPSQPWPLDNSAFFRRNVGGMFTFAVDETPYSALRSLKRSFSKDVVLVRGRPELLVTRRHGGNTCRRPCGHGPEWLVRG